MSIFSDLIVDGVARNIGGTLAVANAAQDIAVSNPARKFFCIQNQSNAALWVNGQGAATQDFNSIEVSPGQYFECDHHLIGRGTISIIGSVTAQAFFARES